MKGDRIVKYEYNPNDPKRFSTDLRYDLKTKNLIWDNASGQNVMIVQTPFGESAVSRIEEICVALEKIMIYPNKYIEVLSNIWIRFVTIQDKAKNNGCPLNGEASTYTVFSYEIKGNITAIFAPKNQAMISSSCDIPLELHAEVKRMKKQEGFFFKREIDTGFYSITFSTGISSGYIDGSIQYKINDFVIPVTKLMLIQGTIYIKTDVRPVLVSNNIGIKLV